MDNNTAQADDFPDWLTALDVVNLIICVVGIIGNALMIAVVSLVKTMRSTVNLCLVCLASVDLALLVLQLMKNTEYLMPHFSFGHYSCALNVVYFSFIPCSHLIFLLIGVERYTLLCHPLKSLGWWTREKVGLALVVIFVVSAALAVPFAVNVTYVELLITVNETKVLCFGGTREPWLKLYLTIQICVTSFLPVPALIWLYGKMVFALKAKVPQRSGAQGVAARRATKSRFQAVMMLVVVVTVFTICVLPFESYGLVSVHAPDIFYSMSEISDIALNIFIQALLYVNHASHPIIYFLMSDSFRQAFKSVICRCHRLNPGCGVS